MKYSFYQKKTEKSDRLNVFIITFATLIKNTGWLKSRFGAHLKINKAEKRESFSNCLAKFRKFIYNGKSFVAAVALAVAAIPEGADKPYSLSAKAK